MNPISVASRTATAAPQAQGYDTKLTLILPTLMTA
jgi:hypothetical protein